MLSRLLFGSQAASPSSIALAMEEEIDRILNTVFDLELPVGQRKQASFALKTLSDQAQSPAQFARAYSRLISARSQDFASISSTNNEEEEAEDIAQTLMDVLLRAVAASSRETNLQYLLAKESPLPALLLDICKQSSLVWVRVGALETIKALVDSCPEEAVDKLLSVPNALETLMEILVREEQTDVRSALVLLLLRLTQCSNQQVSMFIMFCDGPAELLRIAGEEARKQSVMSGDCIAIIVNVLRGNLVGQKQFVETQAYLNSLTVLLDMDQHAQGDSTPCALRIAQCVELVRILCQGRVESLLPVVNAGQSAMRDVDTRVLQQAQTRLGATPHLMERLFQIVSAGQVVDAETRQEAMRALGDLVCKHSNNASKLERLGGFAQIVRGVLNAGDTQQRWADSRAGMYAWICALDKDEQRAIALIGSAAVAAAGAEEEESAVSMVAQALVSALDDALALREEVYVDPARVQALRSTVWKSCRLWEVVLGSSALAREMALRVEDGKHGLLFTTLCSTVPLLMREMDEPETVKELVSDCIANILRVLVIWLSDSPQTVRELLSSTANLFFFDASEGLFALVAAASLVADAQQQQGVAFGLVEKRMGGAEVLLERLASAKRVLSQQAQASGRGFTWQDDSCTRLVVDPVFFALVERLIKDTDHILVRGSSSSSSNAPLGGGDKSGQPAAMPVSETESKLQRDHAKLLLALTCKQVEIESLLQSIETLSGKQAREDALEKARALVSKILEE